MAGSIKGIIVEIGGDTSGLQKALSKVNSVTSSLSKELRGVNSLLKLDPKNTELLGQKQEILNKQIEETKNKLTTLQQIKDEADKKMAEGTLINEENYRALQREIINTQNKLDRLQLETSNWTATGKKIEEIGNKIEDLGSKAEKLGNKLTTSVTLPIAALTTLGITYNAEIEKYTTAFTTFLGDAEKAEETINNIKEDAAKTPFDTTSLVQANQMLISTGESAEDARKVILALGDAVTATGGGNDELTRMAANLQQIKNAGKATALDIKQFAYAGIDIYGMLADYTGKTTAEVKDMEISYEDLTEALKKANQQGGKYYNAMSNASETLTGQTSQLKAETKDMLGELTESLMPVAKKVVSKAKELTEKFNDLSDSEKENILKTGLLVAAIGPAIKIIGTLTTTVGTVTKGIGTFTQAIGVMKTGVQSSNNSVNNLAVMLKGLTSPTGIATTAIIAMATVIITEIKKAEEETKKSFSNMGEGASGFVKGISNATSYLDSFNETLFASSEEQQKLQDDMEEVQKGITEICKIASEERRDYTQEEITQLEEYFNKLRELKNRELEIQKSVSSAITQQAEQNAQTFQGSLTEYEVVSQKWIKTAEEQASKEIAIINDRTTQEIALLQQRYGEKATLENEEYAREYNVIQENKNKAIKEANDEVAKVNLAYANGYLERSKQNDSFYEIFKDYNSKIEDENNRHNNVVEHIQDSTLLTQANKNKSIYDENYTHQENMKDIWKKMYKNMTDEQANELGTWIAMLAQTELYGGEISDENQKMVDKVLESYDDMPDKTKEAMKDAMSPMLEEMENAEPELFAKATGIADGILSRLKKSFDIHSPSRETRNIFQNVMRGAELGLEDEQQTLNKKVDTITKQMKNNFSNVIPNMREIKQSVIDQTKTVFTTPNITFNVQKMDEANLNTAFNYINRRLGSQY